MPVHSASSVPPKEAAPCPMPPLLTAPQLELLIEASSALWRDVEPAIFGTLLERALDPVERHKLGAHYTPRAYVERLVLPTIMEPLRAEWDAVRAAALAEMHSGKPADAVATVREYLQHLCHVRILDPACGSGNFLYVALEHMKRLEGEVLAFLRDLGERQTELMTVDPHQFLGIEVNPRAAAIADLVLWIGYLQWHLRTRAKELIPEPVIHKFHNIDCRDAVLVWDAVEELKDVDGQPVTRWDGRTMKPHPVTGELVPDETARVAVMKYINPRKAEWPQADYIVGNPPFLGTKRMRLYLGDGYVEALRATFSDVIEDNADLVLYWWHFAAEAVCKGNANRFGLITTNSISQAFNRRVISHWLEAGIQIKFAIPDHPWVDSATTAAVRIAMTCCESASGALARLVEVVSESDNDAAGEALVELKTTEVDRIHADLRIGADISDAPPLSANDGISGMGVALHGAGFILTPDDASRFRTYGAGVIKSYLGGRDLQKQPRERYLIDFSFLSEAEASRANPAAFQHVIDHVKPERDVNRRDSIRRLWWRFGWERPLVRKALGGISRFIATTETSKHRAFQFVGAEVLPDHMIVVIALEDAYFLGVLSSRIHVLWSLEAGGRLGVGNDPRYNKTRCFAPFPFPVASAGQRQRIRDLAERLDAHRKQQQAAHPDLTLTGMYNVLEKLRSSEPLTAKEKTIHEQGLVSVLKQLHDDLDAAVFEAYDWPVTLTDEEILERLVALNAERAAEEERGLIRWLRPEFQNPAGGKGAVQKQLDVEEDEETAKPAKKKPAKAAAAKKQPWPKKLAEQAAAVAQALQAAKKPVTPADVGQVFMRANSDDVVRLLEMLAAIGKARTIKGGKYVAS